MSRAKHIFQILVEKAPPGFEGTVKAMKKHKDIDNPYALSWWMKNRGAKSHKKKDGTDKSEGRITNMPSLKFDGLADGVGKEHDDWVNASPYWSNDDREMSRAGTILDMAEQVLEGFEGPVRPFGKGKSASAKKRDARKREGFKRTAKVPKKPRTAERDYDQNIAKPWAPHRELEDPARAGVYGGTRKKK